MGGTEGFQDHNVHTQSATTIHVFFKKVQFTIGCECFVNDTVRGNIREMSIIESISTVTGLFHNNNSRGKISTSLIP